jgi:hypothetical protein
MNRAAKSQKQQKRAPVAKKAARKPVVKQAKRQMSATGMFSFAVFSYSPIGLFDLK